MHAADARLPSGARGASASARCGWTAQADGWTPGGTTKRAGTGGSDRGLIDSGVRTTRDIVSALWLAHREGRVDDMLALLDPAVIWQPFTRPGRSVYVGHDGVRQMLADGAAAHGNLWIELDDLREPSLASCWPPAG